MKKLLLLILISTPVFSEELIIKDLSGGIYSNASLNVIPDNTASYIQNFFSDVEPLIIERNGYEKRDTTALGNPSSVSGLWRFIDNTGAEWIITFSSRTFYKNTVGGTPTQFGLVATVDESPDCAVNLGKIWCVNGTDKLWWFDGTSTGVVTISPNGNLIEPWRNRIIIASSDSFRSTLYFSEDGDGTNWVIGGNPTDPFVLNIGGANDGYEIKCLWGAYIDNLIVGRKQDIWAISGFDQADVVNRNVSSEIGCIQDGSMREWDGSLLFLSGRGMEEMNGTSIKLISEPIRDITDQIVRNTVQERYITQTSQSDWGAGSYDTLVYVDTETSVGNIQTTFPDSFTSFRTAENGGKVVWSTYTSGGTPPTCTYSIVSNEMNLMHSGGTLGDCSIRTDQLVNFSQGTTYHVVITSVPTDANGADRVDIELSSHVFSSPTTPGPNSSNGIGLFFFSTTSGRVGRITITNGLVNYSSITVLNLPLTVDFFISTTNYSLSLNNSLIVTSTHAVTNIGHYIYISGHKTSSGNGNFRFDNFGVAPQTFTYTSQLLNPGTNITSWKLFKSNQTLGDATITYQIGSTNTASLSAITNYQTITGGSIPTIATGSYAAVKATFRTDEWDDAPVMNDFTILWSERNSQPIKSWNYDRRYWLAYTTASGASPYNDRVLVYQRNRTWTLLKGINAASFATWRDALYFGNSNATGYVYKFDTGNNDDGSNIESIIQTKSYDLGDFVREKSFHTVYLNYNGALGKSGDFTLKYKFNQVDSTETTLKTFQMTENLPGSVRKAGFPRGGTVQGREISYNLRKSGTGDRLKLYQIWTKYSPKEVR